jgi:two-component system LytT family response regulator
MPISVLLVDDEPLAREGLRLLLAPDPDVAAIHEAREGREAVAAIRRFRPDLVMLDVQMPEMDGFAVVREIGAAHMPATIFVTAHDRHAVEAFEIHAVDYLLKPVGRERFAAAMARAKAGLAGAGERMSSLLESRRLTRFAVRSGAKTLLIAVEDVDWIGAAENYVELHAGRAAHLVRAGMNAVEKALDPAVFLRIHRSVIVNVTRIRELEPAEHGEYVVTLASGIRLRSGRSYHEALSALAANPF